MLHTDIAGKFPIVAAVSSIEKVLNSAQPTTPHQGCREFPRHSPRNVVSPSGVSVRPKRVSAPEVDGKPK